MRFFIPWMVLKLHGKMKKHSDKESILALVLIPIAFWLGENSLQVSLLIFSVLIVLITELLNTGVEAAIDRISIERHDLSKRAKDIGSAAVFVSLTALTVVWGFAVYEKFF